eukprot:COSAG01_NODE_547_length_15635_cov_102.896498_5_plen_378_part_00
MLKKLCCLSLLMLFASASFANTIDSVKGPGAMSITAFDRESSRQIGGYFDTEFVKGKDTNKFVAHRFVLEMSSQLHDKLLFSSELEFEYGANTATSKNGEIKIEQAWFDFEFNEALVNRTGIIVVPFGRLNVLHDSDVRDATNRPIFAKYIVPTTWMDTGTGFHGVIDKDDWLFAYDAYLINGLNVHADYGTSIKDGKGVRSARPIFKADNNENKAFIGRFMASPSQGLALGTSYYTGKYDDLDKKNLSIIGLDAMYKKGPFESIAEWGQVSIDKSDAVTVDKMSGYYLELRYHLPIMSGLLKQNFDHPVVTLFARQSEVDTDTSNKTKYDRRQLTLGFNYRPVDTVVYKFEYEINSEAVDNGKDDDKFVASLAVGF